MTTEQTEKTISTQAGSKSERLHAKATELRIRGDALYRDNRAESKRLLRKCLRLRRAAYEIARTEGK